MAYKELKFTKPRIVKNQPKPPSKHIQTADLGTTIQFLSDNLNNIAHGAAAFNLAEGMQNRNNGRIICITCC